MKLTDREFTALSNQVASLIKLDAPLSRHIVTLAAKDVAKYKDSVVKFYAAVTRISKLYSKCVESSNLDHPLVTLLEKGVPPELLPYIRKEPAFLNFTRLDFQGHQAIEYNSSPGFMILTMLAGYALSDLSPAGQHQGASPIGANIAPEQLIYEDVLLPLFGSNQNKNLAILERCGERWQTNIGGELEYLASKAHAFGINAIYPCSETDFIFKDKQLLHVPTSTQIDVVHLAASEGRDFERWHALIDTPIFAAYQAGCVQVWPRPANALFTSKFILAYLSDPGYDLVLGISMPEREFLNDVLPWTRLLTPSIAQTAKVMIKNGMKIVIKPGHGSGGRGVEILTSDSRDYSYLLNKHSNDGDYVCMQYAAADSIAAGLSSTMDAVMFSNRDGTLGKRNIVYTSRVFQGKKVNTVSEGAGLSPVILANDRTS